MEVVVILIPLAILLGALFIGGFIWMTYNGQYDDLETPKYKMLLEDKYAVLAKKEKTDEL